jgi:hypothetical protein
LNKETHQKIIQLESVYRVPLVTDVDRSKEEELINSISSDIERICKDCGISFYPSNSWEARNLIRDLELMSDPSNIDRKNTVVTLSIFFSAVLFFLFLYLSVALFKFKTLNAHGIAFLALLVFPAILLSFFMSTLTVSKYYSYETDLGLWWVIVAITYIFLVYPALWRYSAARSLSVKSLIKLKGK